MAQDDETGTQEEPQPQAPEPQAPQQQGDEGGGNGGGNGGPGDPPPPVVSTDVPGEPAAPWLDAPSADHGGRKP